MNLQPDRAPPSQAKDLIDTEDNIYVRCYLQHYLSESSQIFHSSFSGFSYFFLSTSSGLHQINCRSYCCFVEGVKCLSNRCHYDHTHKFNTQNKDPIVILISLYLAQPRRTPGVHTTPHVIFGPTNQFKMVNRYILVLCIQLALVYEDVE